MFTSTTRRGFLETELESVSFSQIDSHSRFHFISFQSLQKLFTTHEWKLDKADKRQTKCVSSLQLALPQKALHLFAVNMKKLLGVALCSRRSGNDRLTLRSLNHAPYMALAVGLDPYYLYQNLKGVMGEIGLVYKPNYINTMSFADAHMKSLETIWRGPAKV